MERGAGVTPSVHLRLESLPMPASSPSSPIRQLLLASAAGFGLSLLGALPAGAHSLGGGGLGAGFGHPLLGLDHLLLLVGVGAAASFIHLRLLLFALAGAVLGALIGVNGIQLPWLELGAALAVSALGLLVLRRRPGESTSWLPLSGALVAGSVAVHGLLHGQEASGAASWWLGALLSSALVVGVTVLTLRRLSPVWTLRLAVLLSLAGAVLALAPIGLLAAGAGA